jgi:hypothetical protein
MFRPPVAQCKHTLRSKTNTSLYLFSPPPPLSPVRPPYRAMGLSILPLAFISLPVRPRENAPPDRPPVLILSASTEKGHGRGGMLKGAREE